MRVWCHALGGVGGWAVVGGQSEADEGVGGYKLTKCVRVYVLRVLKSRH